MTKNKSTMNADNIRLSFFDQSELPNDGNVCIRDSYWISHPLKGLVVYINTPQCNTNKNIIEKVAAIFPWAEIKYYEVAWVRVGD